MSLDFNHMTKGNKHCSVTTASLKLTRYSASFIMKYVVNLHPHSLARFCLFALNVCVCVWPPKLDEMGFGASINTVSEEAHGVSDPPVNLHGGCRGHCRGQRSSFMHITNNAALLPTAKADSRGNSHEPLCVMKNNYLSNIFYKHFIHVRV